MWAVPKAVWIPNLSTCCCDNICLWVVEKWLFSRIVNKSQPPLPSSAGRNYHRTELIFTILSADGTYWMFWTKFRGLRIVLKMNYSFQFIYSPRGYRSKGVGGGKLIDSRGRYIPEVGCAKTAHRGRSNFPLLPLSFPPLAKWDISMKIYRKTWIFSSELTKYPVCSTI